MGKKCVVTTNRKKSAEAIVPENSRKGRTIVSPKYISEGGQHEESRISGRPELPAKR